MADGNRTMEAIGEACRGHIRRIGDKVSFSSDHKWSALALDDEMGQGLYVLGAPEALKPSLESTIELDLLANEWASRGLRVLLFAYRADRAPL